MPQRAVLDGDVSVFAFDTTDDGQWAGLTAAYKADKLLLPCCSTDKNALGFIQENAYQQAAFSERLIIAVDGRSGEYIGHLFFGGRYPQGRVFQVFVDPAHRRKGVANQLFDVLFDRFDMLGFTEVSARVAADLEDANILYEKMGFSTCRQVPGGQSKNRRINLKVKELAAPDLFRFASRPPVANTLNLPEFTTSRPPTYLIDLNVLFDVIKERPSTQAATMVMQAGFRKHIQVAVTSELQNELVRTAYDPDSDPVLKIVKNFYTIQVPKQKRLNEIINLIAPVVFSERHQQGKLKPQDISDLTHLATAIDNRVAGFVTSDGKILSATKYFRSEYSIDVIPPYELEEMLKDDLPVEVSNVSEIGAFSDHFSIYRSSSLSDVRVQAAIRTLNVASHELPGHSDDLSFIAIHDENGVAIGFSWWVVHSGASAQVDAYITANQDSVHCEGIVDFLCNEIIQSSCKGHIARIAIRTGGNMESVRHFIIEHGFKSEQNHPGSALQKVCIGHPVHSQNWHQVRLKINQLTSGILLPKDIPDNLQQDTYIEVTGHDGRTFVVKCRDLEQLLSPTLFVSEDRDGVIVPITRNWSADLFGTDEQNSLFPPAEVMFRRERVYFSDPRTKSVLAPGRVIMFYESGSEKGGRKQLIAIGRITQSNVVLLDDIGPNLLRRGVLDRKMLDKLSTTDKQTVTFFDNIMMLRNPIPFSRLEEMGCDKNAKFVTATKISAKQLETILIEGQPHVAF